MKKKIRVLIIDDSILVRNILKSGLNKHERIEVVGTAGDAYQARDLIEQLKPDVLTLDVEMPRMDGVSFLRKLMPQYPIPVIMVSAVTERGTKTALDALEAGAVDIVLKPSANAGRDIGSMVGELQTKVLIASTANVSHWKAMRLKNRSTWDERSLAAGANKVVAIAASTGGTEAIRKVLDGLPVFCPGVVVVQHMPPGFTRSFADRLNAICPMVVKEAEEGDRVMAGRVLIAPGGLHMTLRRTAGSYIVRLSEGAKVSGHCPSADVMFHSVAKVVGKDTVAAILTGMGKDGAEGMGAIRKAGGRTLAQDEATSVVWGMPKQAWDIRAAERLYPIHDIAGGILECLLQPVR